MHPKRAAPAFEDFLRFVASRHRASPKSLSPPDGVLAAARAARRELRDAEPLDPATECVRPLVQGSHEILQLLAASSDDMARPSDLVTVRGFRVKLDYRDGTDTRPSSICVLVQCPEQLLESVQGRIAYLWNGAERFELGEFDADGKAIGTLPAGIEITLADFATGRIKLEAPEAPGGG